MGRCNVAHQKRAGGVIHAPRGQGGMGVLMYGAMTLNIF